LFVCVFLFCLFTLFVCLSVSFYFVCLLCLFVCLCLFVLFAYFVCLFVCVFFVEVRVTLLFSFLCGVVFYLFVFVLCLVFYLFVFVLCLVFPMLSVSLNCPFIIAFSVFSRVYFLPVSCVPNVASVSGLYIHNSCHSSLL